MNGSYLFRLIFLTVALVVVMTIMQNLSKKGLGRGLTEFLGMNSSTQTEGFNTPVTEQLSWCETRVQAVTAGNGQKLMQEKYKWYRLNGERQELDFIAVEKWFARNCIVPTTPAPMGSPVDSAQVVMTVDFIKGASAVLKRTAEGFFMWRDYVFSSPQLESALQELGELPRASGPKATELKPGKAIKGKLDK